MDCLAAVSVIVILSRWINGSDGSGRFEAHTERLQTREIGLNPWELNGCELHVRLPGFV